MYAVFVQNYGTLMMMLSDTCEAHSDMIQTAGCSACFKRLGPVGPAFRVSDGSYSEIVSFQDSGLSLSDFSAGRFSMSDFYAALQSVMSVGSKDRILTFRCDPALLLRAEKFFITHAFVGVGQRVDVSLFQLVRSVFSFDFSAALGAVAFSSTVPLLSVSDFSVCDTNAFYVLPDTLASCAEVATRMCEQSVLMTVVTLPDFTFGVGAVNTAFDTDFVQLVDGYSTSALTYSKSKYSSFFKDVDFVVDGVTFHYRLMGRGYGVFHALLFVVAVDLPPVVPEEVVPVQTEFSMYTFHVDEFFECENDVFDVYTEETVRECFLIDPGEDESLVEFRKALSDIEGALERPAVMLVKREYDFMDLRVGFYVDPGPVADSRSLVFRWERSLFLSFVTSRIDGSLFVASDYSGFCFRRLLREPLLSSFDLRFSEPVLTVPMLTWLMDYAAPADFSDLVSFSFPFYNVCHISAEGPSLSGYDLFLLLYATVR